jgi:hypothetical protein
VAIGSPAPGSRLHPVGQGHAARPGGEPFPLDRSSNAIDPKMIPHLRTTLPLLVGAALGATASAQDSTALNSVLPGDALDPTSATEQVNDYVVDVAALQSSSGRTWGVAPIAKASQDFLVPSFYSASISAHTISRETLLNVPFARASYLQWDAAGAGVNGDPLKNNPGTPVATAGATGNQFGYSFSQFSSDDPNSPTINFNSIVAGVVNYDPATPSRLYVSRVQAANNDKTWQCNVSQFGVGAADANGRITLRGDGFGTTSCGGYLSLAGNNYYVVDTLARAAGTVNVIANGGADDAGATQWVLVNDADTSSPPTMVPTVIAGGVPIVIGSNFAAQNIHGTAAPLTKTQTHFAAGVTDQRGLASYTKQNFPGVFGATAALGTAGALGVAAGTNTLNVWGVGPGGAPVAPKALTYPGNASISDPTTGWAPAAGSASFSNYYSSTAFRGGTGQVALGKDQAGRLMASAIMNHPGFVSTSSPDNMIVVARTADGVNVEWTVAAYCLGNDGKPVYGNFGNTQVGKLVGFEAGNLAPVGPAMSSPMIDSVGNVYFNARVEFTGETFYRDSLVRAVYDPATFGYTLEVVVSEGDVVLGGNSNTPYRIDFLQTASTVGSNPSAPFSQNINGDGYAGQATNGLATGDTGTLGGVVLRATIVYDVDGDGDFDRQAIDPASLDQDYQTLLFVTAAEDCNGNGVPDDLDIADGTSADQDMDQVPDECGAGVPFCFGDGTGAICPCGNFGGAGEGCANSSGQGGMLFTTGSPSIASDDLGFDVQQLPASKPALLFAGPNLISPGLLFGDGLRCVGGSIRRLGIRITNGSGQATWAPSLQAAGGWASGDTRYFQVWFRDPSGGPCGFGFNTSAGTAVSFIP